MVQFTENWYQASKLAQLVRLARSVSVFGDFVEIGTWEGRSALALAEAIASRRLCVVDHWLGDTDNAAAIASKEGINPASLQGRDVYARFVANVEASGLTNICVHRGHWREYATVRGNPIAFLHLDSSHDYETVRDQLALLLPQMATGGLIAGDDWLHPGTQRAVYEAIPDVQHIDNLWWKQL